MRLIYTAKSSGRGFFVYPYNRKVRGAAERGKELLPEPTDPQLIVRLLATGNFVPLEVWEQLQKEEKAKTKQAKPEPKTEESSKSSEEASGKVAKVVKKKK